MESLKFMFQLFHTSIKASMSIRGAFLIQCFLMVLNNFVFLTIWWVFFRQFKDIAGWQLQDMLALMAIGAGAYGLSLVLFGGVRQLSRAIITGDVDTYMTKPKNLLIQLAASRSYARGWGDILTTVILIFLGNMTQPHMLLVIVVGVLCGCLMFSAMGIIAHSMTFWMGAIEDLARHYMDSLFLFVLYPTHIYTGMLKLVMFTLIPAGIIGFLPVELIRNFSIFKLLLLVGITCVFLFVAFFIFFMGLRRYESGNQFGSRL